MKLWKSLWNVSHSEIQIVSQETIKDDRETGKQVLELAKVLKEYKSDLDVIPLIRSISSLLDVLNLPLIRITERGISFVAMFAELLNLIIRKTKQEPSIEMCVALGSQTAYLESLRQFFKLYPKIEKTIQASVASEAVAVQIKNLGEKLELDGEEFELDTVEMEKIIGCFRQSKLAKVFSQILILRLQESGLEEDKAKIISDRVSRNTHRYLKQSFIRKKNSIPRLVTTYGQTWQQDLDAYLCIDKYLENVIKQKAEEPVFADRFSFKDIYVSLEVKPVKSNGEVNHNAKADNIEHWAQALLQSDRKQGQVLFIQAEPGRGKSIFCRIFADWVRRELHPIWAPILINLRELKKIESDFEQTIATAVSENVLTRDRTWLTDPNTHFLFLLDGLDELILERGFSINLKLFLEQVASFQKRFSEDSDHIHRVLITGRSSIFSGSEKLLPSNFKRVEILPMSEVFQERWFNKWQIVMDSDPKVAQSKTNKFKELFLDPRCPQRLKQLSQEPLILYLLAAMHRDDYLKIEMFKDIPNEKFKLWIYEKVAEISLNRQEFTAEIIKNGEDLRNILAEAALCAEQSGREYVLVSTLETRLQNQEDDETANIFAYKSKPIKNRVAAFYLNSLTAANNSISFFHKSFSEFFFSERIVKSLQEWTSIRNAQSQTYAISTKELEWEIYDLFGYGNLTPEILENLMAFLSKSEVDVTILFKRLNDFYLKWSDGKFIEATEEILPLKKVRLLKQQGIERGLREIDIYTGQNVLMLLLELHRYALSRENLKDKILFHPCGQPNSDNFDPTRLLRVFNYSRCIASFGFNQKLGKCFKSAQLSQTDLSGIDLSGVDFSDVNLSEANLKVTDLRRINLKGANLSGANLSDSVLRDADLSGANFQGADLSRCDLSSAILKAAKLIGVNLIGADLSGANIRDALLNNSDLSGADLSGADLRGAQLKDLKWDSETNWTSAIGVKTIAQKPEMDKISSGNA